MNTSRSSSNTPENVFAFRLSHQKAAMRAALLVCCQYSCESKAQFSRECLDHLKASLVPGRETFA